MAAPMVTAEEQRALLQRVNAEFADIIAQDSELADMAARAFGRTPRYRYWRCAGREYHYTTEPVSGRYWAQEFRPAGPGARTLRRGISQARRLVEARRVGFVTRKQARARAYKWFQTAQGRGE